jgi:hypothetical protein
VITDRRALGTARMLPETAGTLRARIQIRVELARDLDPQTLDYLLAHQRIAALEHKLAAMEGNR